MNQVATFASKKPADIEKALDVYAPQLQKVLIGTGIDSRRYARMAVSLIMGNAALQECEQTSVFKSLMTAAQLGLEPDNVLGQVYLVPFWDGKAKMKKAQVIVGYKGFIRLADNAGWSVHSNVVRALDEFEFEEGTERFIRHKPKLDAPADEQNPIVAVYAIAIHRESKHQEFVVMTTAQVHAIRDRSEGYKFAMQKGYKTPWEGPDYEWMVKKTAIRQMAPRLPVQVQRAAMIDALAEQGREVEIDPDSNTMREVNNKTSANQPEILPGMDAPKEGSDNSKPVDVTPPTVVANDDELPI